MMPLNHRCFDGSAANRLNSSPFDGGGHGSEHPSNLRYDASRTPRCRPTRSPAPGRRPTRRACGRRSRRLAPRLSRSSMSTHARARRREMRRNCVELADGDRRRAPAFFAMTESYTEPSGVPAARPSLPRSARTASLKLPLNVPFSAAGVSMSGTSLPRPNTKAHSGEAPPPEPSFAASGFTQSNGIWKPDITSTAGSVSFVRRLHHHLPLARLLVVDVVPGAAMDASAVCAELRRITSAPPSPPTYPAASTIVPLAYVSSPPTSPSTWWSPSSSTRRRRPSCGGSP